MLISLIILIVVIATFYWWFSSNRRRETALQHAMQYCQQHDLQLLDDSVHCHRLNLCKAQGRIRIKATYRFDYTGHDNTRQCCHMTIVGNSLSWISAANHAAATQQAKSTAHAKVLDFLHHKKPKNDDTFH